MPLKPELFHGHDDIVEEVTQLLMEEEPSCVCILGSGGMGSLQFRLMLSDVVGQPPSC